MIVGSIFSAFVIAPRAADLPLLLAGGTLLGVFLVANGVYVLACGKIGPDFGKHHEAGMMSYTKRFPVAALYIVFGAGVLVLMLTRGRP